MLTYSPNYNNCFLPTLVHRYRKFNINKNYCWMRPEMFPWWSGTTWCEPIPCWGRPTEWGRCWELECRWERVRTGACERSACSPGTGQSRWTSRPRGGPNLVRLKYHPVKFKFFEMGFINEINILWIFKMEIIYYMRYGMVLSKKNEKLNSFTALIGGGGGEGGGSFNI